MVRKIGFQGKYSKLYAKRLIYLQHLAYFDKV